MSTFHYVVSTYWYADADAADSGEITTTVETVYPTLDAALDNMYEHIQTMSYPHDDMSAVRSNVYLHWDPVNNRMKVTASGKYRFLISRVEMFNKEEIAQ